MEFVAKVLVFIQSILDTVITGLSKDAQRFLIVLPEQSTLNVNTLSWNGFPSSYKIVRCKYVNKKVFICQ